MKSLFLSAGSIFAGLAVILGAFGAHALKGRLSFSELQVFETGVKYQFYHSLALIILYLIYDRLKPALLNWSGILMIGGIIFFSGSLYLLSTAETSGLPSMKKFLGPITPLGGLMFIGGWVLLLVASLKK
jgi:uncharacterized membrane protein YgdD (TMEM256/DUF423 family)